MDSSKPLVLVVHPDPYMTALQAAVVTSCDDLNCETANSMRRAMEMISANPPDLIVTDDLLGDGNGRELCRWVRTQSPVQAVPVIMWAGYQVDQELLRSAGIDVFMPMGNTHPEEMLKTIRSLIENYAAFRKEAARNAREQ